MRFVSNQAVSAAIILAAASAGCSFGAAPTGSPESASAPAPDTTKTGLIKGAKAETKDAPPQESAPAADLAAAESPLAEPAVNLKEVLPPIIEGFQSRYSVELFAAAETLRQLPPAARREALLQLSAHDSSHVRAHAWEAFGSWATRDDVPTLLTALQSPHGDVRLAALDLLARFPNEQTIGVLAQALANPDLRLRSERLLVCCGPAAEGALLPLVQHADVELRAAGWRILGKIGARPSLLALTQLQVQEAYRDDAALAESLEKIKERLRE